MRIATLGLARTSLRHATTPWAITTSAVGFICDVLKPSGNLAPYLFIVSAIGFAIIFWIFRKRSKTEGLEKTFNSSLGGFLSFFGLSTVAWLVLSLVFLATPPQGIAAATIPGLETFQKQVLKIGLDVTEIKGTVGRIEEKIDALAKNGTIVPNPKSPEEFYHNARFYEVKGNNGEAEKAYQKFLEMAPDYVDAHIAYQTLMNNTQGIEVTRQVYTSLQIKYPNDPITAMMATRLISDRNERLAKLQALSIQYPKSGPLFYELAQEYLRPGPGNVTIEETKNAKIAFDQFKALDAQGMMKPYYIDKQVLDEVYKKRDEFEKMVTAFYGSMIDRPVEMKVEVLPNLVSVSIIPKERNVQKIFYSIDDPNPTIDTGISPWLKDPMTGQPMPNFQVTGKVGPGKHMLYTKYLNSQNKESQVFSEPFDVTPIQARFIPLPGNLGSTSLNFNVDFQSLDGKDYEFFYGLDQPNPDKKATGTSLTLNSLPAGPHQLFYYGVSGGSKTNVYSLKLSQ
jgi:tetratricopeptide (TPR) repeat protein